MNAIDAAVGRRVKRRRKALGLSQTELATCIGVKFQQVQKYESGTNRIAASRLWEISEALDVPVTYFFQDIKRSGATGPADPDQNPETRQIEALIGNVPAPQKHALLTLIRTIQTQNDPQQQE